MADYAESIEFSDDSYGQLCKYSDEILLKKPRSKIRVAVPVLHIVRDHPILLKKYFKSEIYSQAKLLLLNLFGAIKNIFLSVFIGKKITQTKNPYEKVQLLFISHRIQKDDLNSDLDFYFTDLPKNYKSQSVLIDHTREGIFKTQKLVRHQKGKKLLVPKILNFSAELLIHWEMLKESVNLFIEAFQYSGFKRSLAFRAGIDCLSQETAFSIRMGQYISQIVERYNPLSLITTYEGHAWERIVFNEAHAANKNIKCIGYQHAAIFKNQS